MNYQNQRSCQDDAAHFDCSSCQNTRRSSRNTDCDCGNTWRTPRNADCGCGNTWRTPRNSDCGCGNTWRMSRNSDCGCGNTWRMSRNNDCGCGNTWRTPRSSDCGCGNTWRMSRNNDCGCESTRRMSRNNDCGCESTRRMSRNNDCGCTDSAAETCNTASALLSQANAGTVWKNRNACCEKVAEHYSSHANSGCGCAEAATLRPTSCCHDSDCAVGASEDTALSCRSLAMVYSPYQNFQSLYDPRQGLCRGTVFCELDKPFHSSGREY